ncbi:MAG: alanine--tRNA ligase [Oscillospiraceae bacterium]
MEWTGLNELRERFLQFFENKGHLRLASAPLVPQDDASLLLINSGMAPLKKYFLGLEAPPAKRATSCQKCIRTPDIERVGKTSRHGTFFEMLGNFSFGDYFKEEATKWAWEFLTEELKIPADLLWVSIYEEDDEAFEIWTKHRGLPADRIVRMGKEDNFWEIGTGPCGPCSEIYIDRGEKYGCGSPDCKVGCECDRYVEVWNLVFTQFNSDGNGNYTPLDHPNIDTGMGLERLAVAMQGVDNLFEVDTIQAIIKKAAAMAGVTYKKNEKTDVSLRVIADHIRSTVFLVGDGVLPQNEGRGYVLRRLLRRAARHGRLLGINRPFLAELSETVVEQSKAAYPDLAERADFIAKIIGAEEERFAKTIQSGMEVLGTLLDRLEAMATKGRQQIIDGMEAFRLYDTYGFPIDLTQEIAQDRGITVDEEGFWKFMEEQRERARKAHEEQGGIGWEEDVLAEELINDVFVGYDSLDAESPILAIVTEGQLAQEVQEGDEAVVILRETPFYAESGGQVGDTGVIKIGKSIFKISDTKKSPTGNIMHVGTVISGFLAVGDIAEVHVDRKRRHAIMRNHTATHLLQAALREVLGDHVHQAGSYVDEKLCRFDFTHFSAVTAEQLAEVERKVNNHILKALPVTTQEMPLEEARRLGATALFGDKYNDTVRVVTIENTSMELCGGTHASNTAQLGLFKILSESSVAAGVRRIEGTTGRGVLAYIDRQNETIRETGEILKAGAPSELVARARSVMTNSAALQKEVESLERQIADKETSSLDDTMESIGPVRFVSLAVEGSIEALQQKADQLKDKYPDIVGVFMATGEDKTSVLAFAGKDAVKAGAHSGKLVKAVSALAGGSGGGRPDHAMGGIADPTLIAKALGEAGKLLKEQLDEKK